MRIMRKEWIIDAATIYGQGESGIGFGGESSQKLKTELCGKRAHPAWSSAGEYRGCGYGFTE